MTIRTVLRLSRESRLLEGEPHEVDAKRRAAADETLRQSRLEAALRCGAWQSIEDDLVQRRGWYVSSSTDAVYKLHGGVTFEPGSANVLADRVALSFTVGADGSLTFFERIGDEAHTWTSYLEREAERERKRQARASARPAYLDGPSS